MRKATLLYNPSSGRKRREAELERALQVLRSPGVEAEIIVCRSSEEATEQARRAVAAGNDTVFACGGDGTVSDVLQGLAGSETALAILPLGTANALAHDLALPLRLVEAARAALDGRLRRIPLGRIEYHDFSGQSAARYFTVAAGIGVDAHLFYKLTSEFKQRRGMAAYYLKAWQLWATHRMRKFDVEYSTNGGEKQRARLTELLAVRIRFFGGVLRELVPGASLESRELRAVMCRTSSRNAYLQYVAGALLGRRWNIEGIDLVSCSEIACQLPEGGERVYVEADGELLGRLPARLTMVPDALSLVVPARRQWS
ncbi:MAG: YegS/Rv2252/BmrU family lipid kinase [Acidobacteriales bacterium]|nr:YegS/Rv2252/BmrU family lipid kinase [Candidatus Koribacter versatilis]MBI3645190.1 YegS/Rv2252/BmrU family lipid kinase [Terriglobales bacterium]